MKSRKSARAICLANPNISKIADETSLFSTSLATKPLIWWTWRSSLNAYSLQKTSELYFVPNRQKQSRATHQQPQSIRHKNWPAKFIIFCLYAKLGWKLVNFYTQILFGFLLIGWKAAKNHLPTLIWMWYFGHKRNDAVLNQCRQSVYNRRSGVTLNQGRYAFILQQTFATSKSMFLCNNFFVAKLTLCATGGKK